MQTVDRLTAGGELFKRKDRTPPRSCHSLSGLRREHNSAEALSKQPSTPRCPPFSQIANMARQSPLIGGYVAHIEANPRQGVCICSAVWLASGYVAMLEVMPVELRWQGRLTTSNHAEQCISMHTGNSLNSADEVGGAAGQQS